MIRKELYDLVWSTPMLTLSKKYAISDVGLKKICKKMNIPTPPVGYWAKRQFGWRVVTKPLPSNYSGKDDVYLDIRKVLAEGPIAALNRLQREIQNDPSLKWEVPHNLSKPDRLIVESRNSFKEKKNNTSFKGVITCTGLSIIVSPKNVSRSLRFMDTLIKLLRQRGHEVKTGNYRTYTIIDGEEIQIWLHEKLDKVVKENNWTQFHANGLLSFRIDKSGGTIEFVDGKLTIEEQLPRILAKLELLGKKLKAERIAFEQRKAERLEKERIIRELEQRKEKELADFKELLQKAKRFRQVEMLRSYIDVIKGISITNNTLTEEMEIWVKWALGKADWYDPLIESEDELLKDVDRETLIFKRKSYSNW